MGGSSINLGLGWTAGEATDLDASILIYSAKQKLTQAVYHQNLQGKISLDKVPEEGREGLVADDDGKVVIIQHSGDEREGDAEGDDESISINLKAFPPSGTAPSLSSLCTATPSRPSRTPRSPSATPRVAPTSSTSSSAWTSPSPKEIAKTTLASSSVRSTATPLPTPGSSLPVATRSTALTVSSSLLI